MILAITPKCLAESQYALNSASSVYTAPTATVTIIDKFTATNTTSSAATITVYLVPTGNSAGTSNAIVSALSIGGNTVTDLTQLQNQILNAGDFISVVSNTSSAIVVRASGREVLS